MLPSLPKSIKNKFYILVVFIVPLLVPYLIMLSDSHIESSQSICPFKLLTGLPCPGCGITKSIIFLYKGDLIRSFTYHIFGPLVILFCIVSVLVLSIEMITRKEYFNKVLYSSKVAYTFGFVLASYHITRLVIFVSHNSVTDILKQSIWG